MTDGAVHDPRAASLALLGGLIRRGRQLAARSTQTDRRGGPMCPPLEGPRAFGGDTRVGPYGSADDADVRIWQYDCAAAINELSGGSKAHWLSRAYSNALLVRSTGGEALIEADVADIVRRVLDVLEQGRAALTGMNTAAVASPEAQEPHRFDFVHDAELRPVLEQAFVDSRRAFEERDYEAALKTACGIIEAIITDALNARLTPRAPAETDGSRGFSRAHGAITELSFADRIAAAETAGLIRGSCARLPDVARAYRDGSDQAAAISERDATLTRQVLRVVMRDLDPGR
jgi:hypothetical protein